MDRDNSDWKQQLRSNGPDQQSALSDLRMVLLRSLRASLSKKSRIDESLLEDAVQDSLVRILDCLDQFEGRSRFLTWAVSIAIHTTMNELRRKRWKDVSLNELLSDTEFVPRNAVDAAPSPVVQWEQSEIVETMYSLIEDQLTERQRTALLAELKGMPLDEIARHLGSNPNAVYKLTHDARRKLKSGFEAAGFTADDLVDTAAN